MLSRFSLFVRASSTVVAARYMQVIAMPALSPTMEEGKIINWEKKVGEQVAVGQTFCKLETDKATASFDNQDDDLYLAKVIAEPGQVVKVGDPVCICVEDKAELESDEVKNWKPAGAASTSAPTAPAALAAPAVPEKTAPKEEKAPAVKPAPKVEPPKPSEAKPSKPSPAPVAGSGSFEDIPLTSMRKVIAKRMVQSKNQEVPHYYVMEEMNADNMMATIKALNAKSGGKFKISVNDFLIKAIARTNLIVKEANSQWLDDCIRQFNTVDVSVAVATPTGLLTPIIRNAHAKGLSEISIEAKALAKKARDGLLQPNEFQGGTVTISNLGGMGVNNFTAIINQPQSMILAVGTILQKAETAKNAETGEFEMTGKVKQVIRVTASFDHRVIDGAVGAEWMKNFKDTVENPLSLLI